jgi:hypothetical protein
LNVDFKIASACIANRIQPILRNIINETQIAVCDSSIDNIREELIDLDDLSVIAMLIISEES